MAEARTAGIGEAALSAALLAVGAITVGGRLTLRNGHVALAAGAACGAISAVFG